MALAWETYRAIPTLNNYAEAKAWYDNTAPIRGDKHNTKPVGRRDQAWFSIWESKDAIHVGYGRREIKDRTPIVTYKKEGSIILSMGYRGASNNERLQRLLGVAFQTYQYDTWVNCAYYENGETKYGWMPIKPSHKAMFVRDGTALVFVNYKYPTTHKINKERMKAFLDDYKPFLTYISGLHKLHRDERMRFSEETKLEAFGVNPFYGDRNIANAPPNLRWGANMNEHREKFFAWAKSDDPMDQLRAAITIVNMSYWDHPIETFKEYVIRTYKEAVLDAVEHRNGQLVRDKLRNLLL
jgi:hypothetical protein